MNNAQVIEILQRFDDILIQNVWFNTFIRWLGWLIIKGLASLVNTFENVLGKITGLTTFFNNPEITKLINNFRPAMFGLLGLSFCYISYQIFLNKKFEKRVIPTNLIIAITVVILLPSAMLKLNELTQAGVKAVYGEFNSVANEVIDNNITDIYLYDDINFSKKNIKTKNKIPQSQITKIDINETIDKSKTKNEKVFENKVVYEKDGGYDLKRIDGLFKWDNQYYRWKCNFWIIIVTLLTTGITIILTSVKITRLIFELAFNKVFAIIFAFTDIAHGQRLKKTIKNIISIFAVIFCMALMLKIYLIFGSWIETQNLGIIGILATIGMSIAVIDGPNIVEQIFGIDAGLSSAWKTIAGLYAGSRAANELTKGFTRAGVGLSKFMASSGDKVANGMAGVMGFGSGVKDGMKGNNLENQMKEDNNKAKTKGKSDNTNSLEKQMKNEGINLNGNSLGSKDNKGKEGDKSNNKLSEKDIDNNPNNLSGNIKGEEDTKETKGLKDILSDGNSSSREQFEENSSNNSIGNLDSDKNTNSVDNINGSDEITRPSMTDQTSPSNSTLGNKGINDESRSVESLGEQQLNSDSSNINSKENIGGRDNIGSIDSLSKQGLNSINRGLDKESISQGINSGLNSSSSIKPGENANLVDSLDKQGLNAVSTSRPISEGINSSVGIGSINQGIDGGLSSSSSIIPGAIENINSVDSLDKQGLNTINTGRPISEGINSSVGIESINQGIDGRLSSSSSSIKPARAINEMRSTDIRSSSETNNSTQNVIERRTVGEYAKDKFNDSNFGKITTKVKRSYQIGKNTGIKYSKKKTNKEEK